MRRGFLRRIETACALAILVAAGFLGACRRHEGGAARTPGPAGRFTPRRPPPTPTLKPGEPTRVPDLPG